MDGQFYTVEQAAERLKLHPKTVRRFIHDERLKASRVGKSYRIREADLDAFAGVPAAASPRLAVRTMTVIDIEGVDAEKARRLAMLSAPRMAQEAHAELMSVTTHYAPDRGDMKVILVGSVGDVAAMLKLVEFYLDQRQ
jgi:excisionase family DNA binding protein